MQRRLIRLALVFALASYAPVILSCIFGLGWCSWRLSKWAYQHAFTVQSGLGLRLQVAFFMLAGSFDLAALVAILFLITALGVLFIRRLDGMPEGLPISRGREPRFFELLDRICKRLRCRPPESVVLMYDENAAIGEFTIGDESGGRRRNVRTLMIGAGLVVNLQIDEFATVLCHEIAHAAHGDTRSIKLVNRFYMSLVAATRMHDRIDGESIHWLHAVLHFILLGYLRLFELLLAADQRARERYADRAAAEICGPRNTWNALMRLTVLGELPQLTVGGLVEEYVKNDAPIENIYEEIRRRWRELPRLRREAAENEAFMKPTSIWDSHPALSDRMKALQHVQAPEWTAPKPATAIFSDWKSLESSITAALIPVLRMRRDEFQDRLLRGVLSR